MAKEQKDITTLDVQIAEFIRSHKKSGTATDDEINDQLVIPFTLDADGIDDLLQRIQDAGISITDKEGNPSARVLNNEEEEPELTDEELLGSNSATVNDPVRMYLKEIGVVRSRSPRCVASHASTKWGWNKVIWKPSNVWQKPTFVWLFLLRSAMLVVGCNSWI